MTVTATWPTVTLIVSLAVRLFVLYAHFGAAAVPQACFSSHLSWPASSSTWCI
jgi:hypothetical protein